MRFLESDELICLLPAEPAQEAIALDKLSPMFDKCGGNRDRLPALVKLGKLATMQINLSGKPIGLVWFCVELDRLIIDTLLIFTPSRTPKESYAPMWKAVTILANTYGCKSVEGVTARQGLARLYLANGFESRGMLMRKTLS